MSMTVDGTWKAGAWATTVWANGVWREGAYIPVAPTTRRDSGVSKGRVIHLSDLSPDSRQSTADYIKTRMNLPVFKELPPEKPTTYKAGRKSKAAQELERLAELAMRNAEIEAQDEIRIVRNNNAIIAIIMMANQ